MTSPQSLIGLAAFVSLIFTVFGCWFLHRRIRNRASRCLLISVVAFLIWVPAAQVADVYISYTFNASHSQAALNWLGVAIDIFLPSLLLLLASVGFCFAASSVPLQPR